MNIEEKYIWNTNDIYKNNEEFEKDCKEVFDKVSEIKKYKGKLKESSENIYIVNKLDEEIGELFSKLYAYAMLKHHRNMAEPENLKLYRKVEMMAPKISSELSFITPELLSIDESTLEKYLNENQKLNRYKRVINDILKSKKHVLSEEGENILSNYSEVFAAPDNIFTMLSDVDFKFDDIVLENNEKAKLTQGTYIKYLTDPNVCIRKQAFTNMYNMYKKYINTINEIYQTQVKKQVVTAKLRNYNSSLEKAVDAEDSTVEVYNNLIKTVNDNLQINHKYMALKKKLLGIEDMHMYDIYLNSLKVDEENISYIEAQEIIKDALKILGKEYVEKIDFAFNNRWIDVYETENKHSGAYSMGVYGVHPYILTNYMNNINSVSTVAHELGHTMHSYYSNTNQNYVDSDYTIMVAEVASTVNEILLSEYLINKETDLKKKAMLINEQIDEIRATLIRQTMFAEFEKWVHEKVEENNPLTAEDLNNKYYELNKKYFGENVNVDEDIKYEWARIPHFYSCFYVYKYATGISSAITIAQKILSNEKGYVERYLNMLKKGGSEKSLDLLRSVDVDLETKTPIENAFKYYNDKIDELEEIIKKIK